MRIDAHTGLSAVAEAAGIDRREAYRFEYVASLPQERFEQVLVVVIKPKSTHSLVAKGND